MFHAQGALKNSCTLLAVVCGKAPDIKPQPGLSDKPASYPFPELSSSGRLEVHTLTKPSVDEFRRVLESVEPSIVYFQGELVSNSEEIGSPVWGGVQLSNLEVISSLFGSTLPTTLYLEFPNGEKLAEAIHSKGVPYVIYWKKTVNLYASSHFRLALLSVVQSSCSHTWDAFQLAHASFRMYCSRNNNALPTIDTKTGEVAGPYLFGNPPKINIVAMEKEVGEDEEEENNDDDESSGSLPAIKIYDDDVNMRFLICGFPCTLDARLLGSLVDGLKALLNIEIRGSKLHNRVSAPPPPLQAGAFSRGVVTMRCDLSTCTTAHISLLVSGSAQTCFDDQLLESHIKNELIEKSQLVHALSDSEESKVFLSEPRTSASIACGATVCEVCLKVPAWASQVLRQLAPDTSYRNFISLGIASIQGSPVASFEKDDTERILFLCPSKGLETHPQNVIRSTPPKWLKPPTPSRKRSETCQETKSLPSCTTNESKLVIANLDDRNKETRSIDCYGRPLSSTQKKRKIAAMRPVPHTRQHKMMPFLGVSDADGYNGSQAKANLPITPATKHNNSGPPPVTHRKSFSSSYQAQHIISLNPLPLKKHGCGRSPIQVCPEEEFLRDVMQFLILRGHTRLVPQGGLAEFPEAILNAKRLDLYNLYREVVSRGGFHVGNGINWKGQVFSKMRNHTVTNRMTGVGNTLKRHYETYLLEYELAHDDVDGECCLLCHSSAAGDWVNCGICGEWAHFGCDRRQGLGAFKDYAKTDGLEYICPHCSVTNFRKKPQKIANGTRPV
ncbi:hypothetical protein Sjap_012015 [Stephania japonica]|uniref:ARID domain-containing protein n=1 Tax=Stephania japonica TaxID=461633 RepID=A0AAP0P5I2_9MAGN